MFGSRKLLMGVSVVGAAMFLAILTTDASAQSPYQSYQSPYGPTLAPELNYFRRDAGVLNNYQAFVRPQRQLQSTLRSIQANMAQQQRQIQTMGAASAGPVTGTHATFQNYSHFYNFPRR